jgi:transposase-like protein
MQERKQELIRDLAKECGSIQDVQNLLKELFKGTLEEMLEAEMDEHLGYGKHDNEGDHSGNSRNGYGKKTIQTQLGKTELQIPRDRRGEFEPKIISKYQTKTDNLENQIIAMYAKGMSTRDIEDHLREIYGVDASPALISQITDKILPAAREWQNRPLDDVYPIVFFDGVWFKVKEESKVVKKCVYSVLGINADGMKEILGIWISESESASFWTTVFNDMSNRGVKDILIACHDNLSGFSNALEKVFPQTENQLCVIHMVRNSTKYVSYKDLKSLMADLKEVYQAVNEEDALNKLIELGEQWDKKYPQIRRMWEENWSEITAFLRFPEPVRRLIYTTNAVEGFHRMLRKFTKTKTVFPSEESLKKSIYLSIQEIVKKWSVPAREWGIVMGQLSVFFEGRISAA